MSRAERLTLLDALALGALQGPAELLPVSSSAHVALAPWLLRRPCARLDPRRRKAFEVALHAGALPALPLVLGEERRALRPLARRAPVLLALSSLPAAVAGAALERPIERRLGTPPTIAAGLAAGGLALLAADRAPARRHAGDARAADALAIGVAQALALAPGVSRNGAALTAARLRGFAPGAARALSWGAAAPVMAGAAALKGVRLAREGVPRADRAAFAAGAAAAFASTLAAGPLARRVDGDRGLAPWAAYRLALAALVARRWVAARGSTIRA